MNLEEQIYTYMSNVTDKILKSVVIPNHKYKNVKDMNFEELKRIQEKYGIEGIILDIDGTLRNDMKNIDYRNIKWILKLKQMFKVCMLSNGIDKRVEKLASRLEIEYLPLAFKPMKGGFKKALEAMDITDPSKVLVVGDEYLADIVGGQRMNMQTALIEEETER